jgi:hypothetical protein
LESDRPARLSRNICRFLRPPGFGYIRQTADNLIHVSHLACAPEDGVPDLPIGHQQTLRAAAAISESIVVNSYGFEAPSAGADL